MRAKSVQVFRPKWIVFAFALTTVAARGGDIVATFDDLTLDAESASRGPDPNGTVIKGPYGDVMKGSFTTNGVVFENDAELTYGSWSGFAYPNTTAGCLNQFSAFPGSAQSGENYGVAFGYTDLAGNPPTNIGRLAGLPHLTLPTGAGIAGMFVTNTTYAALSMLQGDSFAKKFGGASGDDPDWFKLTAYGADAAGDVLNASVDFYLADYRFADNSKDYIVDDWRYMDLSSLAGARTIFFNVSSTDVGDFSMNTPGYFAVDDIQYTIADAAVPEPSSLVMAGIGAIVLGALARRRLLAS